MPYGLTGGQFAFECFDVSIPHMGCMPYGPRRHQGDLLVKDGFNPSYGLHALRAPDGVLTVIRQIVVSIPHMGCMPYGRQVVCIRVGAVAFQSLIWVACPTGTVLSASGQ